MRVFLTKNPMKTTNSYQRLLGIPRNIIRDQNVTNYNVQGSK